MKYRSSLAAILLLAGGVLASRGETENAIVFTMPHDGWATVAINDANGARARNLFGDLHFTKGEHAVEWDGRDPRGCAVRQEQLRRANHPAVGGAGHRSPARVGAVAAGNSAAAF